MAIVSIPNTFTVGAVIVASQHNSNFSIIYADYNGNIDNTNIAASAAIADTKLAQITTASKVSGTALTSLASIPAGAGVIPTANLTSGIAIETTWADYSATSTIVGWSSFTTKSIFTKKIGKVVFVSFVLAGTSNSTSVSFTLPDTSYNGLSFTSSAYTVDNGTPTTTGGACQIPSNSSTVTVTKTMASQVGDWTNSGTKNAQGLFWYETP